MHTYEIRPGVTPEGFIVETLFDGQRMTMESAKDIREWTKEKIIADFWAGHEKWAKRERTATEIRAGRMRAAEMSRRRNIRAPDIAAHFPEVSQVSRGMMRRNT
jgi:hypothetical protein